MLKLFGMEGSRRLLQMELFEELLLVVVVLPVSSRESALSALPGKGMALRPMKGDGGTTAEGGV